MLIYGYTKVMLGAKGEGKKTFTQLFPSKKRRDSAMYQDYVETFDQTATAGETKMTEAEFEAMFGPRNSTYPEVFGVVNGNDYTVQFEPFSRVV